MVVTAFVDVKAYTRKMVQINRNNIREVFQTVKDCLLYLASDIKAVLKARKVVLSCYDIITRKIDY